MALLARTEHATYCPYKGDCAFYSRHSVADCLMRGVAGSGMTAFGSENEVLDVGFASLVRWRRAILLLPTSAALRHERTPRFRAPIIVPYNHDRAGLP